MLSRLKGFQGQNGHGRFRLNGHCATSAATDHIIQVRQVVKTYHGSAGDFTALKGINLTVNRGEFVAIIGKSGCGKSTLINMITGIDRPSSGEVWVNGTAVHTLSEGEIAQWRGRELGVIFQFFQLLPTLTVMQNVMLPMDFCHTYPIPQRRERAMHLLDMVGLADVAHKLPSSVSGGQQQLAAIARALANDPPILAADEPTGNLDSATAEIIFQLFNQLVDEGKTILMVTHDPDKARRVTRVVTIADGEIIKSNSTAESAEVAEKNLPSHSPSRGEGNGLLLPLGGD
ncbi:MAG: ABC transporter ATP-binding protein [Ardenticatenaceae bacterium]|nr:ABC transporter ATP-binding protein [Ardenticatenaceae bacterium]MCB8988422.1 ABC transporter ATP-binding protein [Ardenticatenaceae bacterium]